MSHLDIQQTEKLPFPTDSNEFQRIPTDSNGFQRIPDHFPNSFLFAFLAVSSIIEPIKSYKTPIKSYRTPSNPLQIPLKQKNMEPGSFLAMFDPLNGLNFAAESFPEVRYSRRSAALEAATSGMEDLVACPAARGTYFWGNLTKNGHLNLNHQKRTCHLHQQKWTLNQQTMGMARNGRTFTDMRWHAGNGDRLW